MSNRRRPDFEIVHSGTWWKDFHARRRERAARAANGPFENTPNALTGNVYTFVPGQATPIVTVAGAPIRATRKSAPSVSVGKTAKNKYAYVAPSGTNNILTTRAHEEAALLQRLTNRETGSRSCDGNSTDLQDVMRGFIEGRDKARIRMARNGYLGPPNDFAGKSDQEILTHLKTPQGREQLKAARENSSRLARECKEKAVAAAMKVQKLPPSW